MINQSEQTTASSTYHSVRRIEIFWAEWTTPIPLREMSIRKYEESQKGTQGEVTSRPSPPKMRLSAIVSLTDFEVAAMQRLSPKAFACTFCVHLCVGP